MTNLNPASGNDTGMPALDMADLSRDALMLSSLIEGLEILSNEAGTEHEYEKRARNALVPYIEVLIEKSWALTHKIEDLECGRVQAKVAS